MLLRNKQKRNRQFYFMRKDGKNLVQDFIHVPGESTVEIDDAVFEQLCKPMTTVQVQERVEVQLTEENIGADIKHGKIPYTVVEYQPTGATKSINLVRQAIRDGELEVVENVKRSAEHIAKYLMNQGIDVSKIDAAAQEALYNRLV